MRTYGMGIIALFVLLRIGDAYAETEPEEITIRIRGEHKAVTSALLEAANEGTPITGIAELDSLAATYGLMGIYHKSGFYGYQFRLTFPPGSDGAAIAGAYGNVSYIHTQSVEPVKPVDSYFLNDRAITRIPTKVGVGVLTTVGLGTVFVLGAGTEGDDGIGVSIAASAALFFGYPLGVYLADPVESSCWMTFIGNGIGWWGGTSSILSEWAGWITVLGTPVLASELSRLLPKRFRSPNPFKWLFGTFGQPIPRVSFDLVPQPQRGLSAVAKLRF